MRRRTVISALVAAAALAAAPAYGSEYQPFQTDFPASSQAQTKFVPGVTDFPSGGPTVQTPALTSDDGIAWGDAGIVGISAGVLALGLAGSALVIRRRGTLAHT